MQKLPRFSRQNDKDFITALNFNVNQYFKENNISKYANGEMVFKTIFYLTFWLGTYLLLIFGDFGVGVNYLLWAILGFFIAMITANIGHDAIHGAYSKHKWLNQLLAHTFNLSGTSAYMWSKIHNEAHHTYPNIAGFDEDIDPSPIIRISPQKQWFKIHSYQHIYAFLLYGLSILSWIFIEDYRNFFANKIDIHSNKSHPKIEYFNLFFYKFLNYSLFLIIPILVLNQSWWQTLLGFILMYFVAGLLLSLIFMLAHVIEETHFPLPDHNGQLDNSFAVHQLRTTANFASKSYLAGFLTGGLNLQVEHHLFPKICSIHYKNISDIVEKTAREYNQPYFSFSFSHSVKSHFNYLKKMGKEEYLNDNQIDTKEGLQMQR